MKLLWISVFACALSLALFSYSFVQRSHDQAQVEALARDTNAALCTFKSSLQQRYDDGVVFLENNPDGIPGISGADIERSLANQKATLDALSELDCS